MEENSKSNNNTDSKQLSESEDNNLKKSLIIFSRMNKYFLIPFLTPVFMMLTNYFFSLIEEPMKKPDLLASVYDQLANCVAGLFYFFTKFHKTVKKEEETLSKKSDNSVKYIYKKTRKYKIKIKLIFLIVILAILTAIYEIFDGSYLDNNIFGLEFIFFIFTPIFSRIILKEDIYKHHYFSLTIGIVGIIIISIPVWLVVSINDIKLIILNFLAALSYSLFFVIIKYVIQEFYISIFKICLIVNLLSILFVFLGFMIHSLIEYNDLSYFEDIFEFSNIENTGLFILFFILAFLFSVISEVLLLLVIFYFSPILLISTEIISPFLLWIFYTIKDGESMPDIIIYPIGYLIVVFASLIYNEIIIFNCWGLSKNTKKFIKQRLYSDASNLKKMEIELKSGDLNISDNDSDNSDDD